MLGGSVPVIRKDAANTTIIEVDEWSRRGTDASESNTVVDVSFGAAAKACLWTVYEQIVLSDDDGK